MLSTAPLPPHSLKQAWDSEPHSTGRAPGCQCYKQRESPIKRKGVPRRPGFSLVCPEKRRSSYTKQKVGGGMVGYGEYAKNWGWNVNMGTNRVWNEFCIQACFHRHATIFWKLLSEHYRVARILGLAFPPHSRNHENCAKYCKYFFKHHFFKH